MTDAGLSHKPRTPKLSALLCFLVGNLEHLYSLLYTEKLVLCGHACVYIHVWMHTCQGTGMETRGQVEAVGSLMYVLGAELRFSDMVASTFTH